MEQEAKAQEETQVVEAHRVTRDCPAKALSKVPIIGNRKSTCLQLPVRLVLGQRNVLSLWSCAKLKPLHHSPAFVFLQDDSHTGEGCSQDRGGVWSLFE